MLRWTHALGGASIWYSWMRSRGGGSTEPTLSGIHELERVVAFASILGFQPSYASTNTISTKRTPSILRNNAGTGKSHWPPRIPFDNIVTEALVHGLLVVEYAVASVTREIKGLWKKVVEMRY